METSAKVKVSDPSKLKIIKTIFESKLVESDSEINKADIIKLFSEYIEDENEFQNFEKIIDNMKDETFASIKKRIKTQYKKTHIFASKIIEEEKYTKESETKIIKEEKNLELEKEVTEKISNFAGLKEKHNDTNKKVEEFYFDKIKSFFELNKYYI